MAINFEQPGAYNAQVGEGYGQLQQMLQNRAMGGGHMGSGGGGGGGYSGGNDGEVTQRDAFLSGQHLQGQMMGQEAQFQNELSLQQNRLTAAEETRMNSLNQALGAINANPNLDEEARNDLRMQIMSGLDPYQRRMAKAKIAETEMHTRSSMQMMDEQSAARDRSRQFATRNLQSLVRNVMDPGIQASVERDLGLQDPELQFMAENGHAESEAEWNRRVLEEARKRGGVSTWIQANADGSHTLLNPGGVPKPEIDLTHINQVHHQIEQEVDKYLSDPLTKIPEGKDREQYREELISQRAQNRQRRMGQGAGNSETNPPPRTQRPFDWHRPAQATPAQQRDLQQFQQVEKSIFDRVTAAGGGAGGAPPPGTMRFATEATGLLNEVRDLLAKYGHKENMPAADKSRYESLQNRLADMILAGPGQQTERPAPNTGRTNLPPPEPTGI